MVEAHTRADKKVWPFNPPKTPKCERWYFDGERYRHRDEDLWERTEQRGRQSEDPDIGPCWSRCISVKTSRGVGSFCNVGLIDTGENGAVYLYFDQTNGHRVAGKLIDVDVIDGRCQRSNEAFVLYKHLREVRHPNVIWLYKCTSNPQTAETLIVMEYCSGGSVEDYVQRLQCQATPKAVPLKFLMHFIASMAEALAYLHEGLRYAWRGHRVKRNSPHALVMHRNVKLANILLRGDPTAEKLPDVVLADFGAAKLVVGDSTDPRYMPPEEVFDLLEPGVRDPSKMSPASDIYALGMCIARLLCCGRDVTKSGLAGVYEASGLEDTAFGFDLLQRCLCLREAERPFARDLLLVAGQLRAQLAAME